MDGDTFIRVFRCIMTFCFVVTLPMTVLTPMCVGIFASTCCIIAGLNAYNGLNVYNSQQIPKQENWFLENNSLALSGRVFQAAICSLLFSLWPPSNVPSEEVVLHSLLLSPWGFISFLSLGIQWVWECSGVRLAICTVWIEFICLKVPQFVLERSELSAVVCIAISNTLSAGVLAYPSILLIVATDPTFRVMEALAVLLCQKIHFMDCDRNAMQNISVMCKLLFFCDVLIFLVLLSSVGKSPQYVFVWGWAGKVELYCHDIFMCLFTPQLLFLTLVGDQSTFLYTPICNILKFCTWLDKLFLPTIILGPSLFEFVWSVVSFDFGLSNPSSWFISVLVVYVCLWWTDLLLRALFRCIIWIIRKFISMCNNSEPTPPHELRSLAVPLASVDDWYG